MASLTWWIWVWVNSGSRWWTGRPGVLWSMKSQRVRYDWVTELNWSLINRSKLCCSVAVWFCFFLLFNWQVILGLTSALWKYPPQQTFTVWLASINGWWSLAESIIFFLVETWCFLIPSTFVELFFVKTETFPRELRMNHCEPAYKSRKNIYLSPIMRPNNVPPPPTPISHRYGHMDFSWFSVVW